MKNYQLKLAWKTLKRVKKYGRLNLVLINKYLKKNTLPNSELCNPGGPLILTVVGMLGTIPKGLLGGLVELLHGWDWPGYWEELWGQEETWCQSYSCERREGRRNVIIIIIIIIMIRPWGPTYTWNSSRQHLNMYRIGKRLSIMGHMCSGFKNSCPTTTDKLIKLSKLDEPAMQDTPGEVGTSS